MDPIYVIVLSVVVGIQSGYIALCRQACRHYRYQIAHLQQSRTPQPPQPPA